VVAELVPAVVRWNREPAYGLAADALADPRVDVVERDVVDVLRAEPRGFDAVILDVDNGAEGLVAAGNDRLYSARGLERLKAALRPGGVLAVWSTADDPAFVERMGRAGFSTVVERARVHAAGGPSVSLLVGRLEIRCPGVCSPGRAIALLCSVGPRRRSGSEPPGGDLTVVATAGIPRSKGGDSVTQCDCIGGLRR